MLYLALAVGCSLSIGMIFKHAGRRGHSRLPLLTVNYAVAFGVALLLLALDPARAERVAPEAGLVLLGVVLGALFIFGFFMLSLATDVAGMSLALGVMRVSVVIPFLASWWIWSETPSGAQALGLIMAGCAFFLISRKPSRRPVGVPDATTPAYAPWKTFVVLATLFVSGGVVDTLMKAFDETYADYSEALFLMLVFGVAFAIGLAFVLWEGVRTGRWPGKPTLAWGVVLGVVNYGSAEFLLRAIGALSGPFVFPANSIAIVVGGALLGVYFWDEHLSRLNWIGLGLAAVALVLLNL